MSDVYFTTNPADWPRLEGLYISERNPPGFIRGRDLGTVGLFGLAVRGPTTPQVVTSYGRFVEIYGEGYLGGVLVGHLWSAMINKPWGTRVIRRVTAAAAGLATVTLDDTAGAGGTAIIRVDATSAGAWGNDVTVSVEAATDGDANHYNLRVAYGGREVLYHNLNTTAANDNLLAVIGDDPANYAVITKLADGRPHNQAGTALTGGTAGALAASDYTAALADLANYEGVAIIASPDSLEDTVAAAAQATLNAAIVTTAAASVDRAFLTWSGKYGDTPANEITAKLAQITTPSDRILWVYNGAKTINPATSAKISTGPHVWLASVLSQIDVDVHPGAAETTDELAGIAELHKSSLTRGDLISLRDAGISTLEKTRAGYQFRSVVGTDTTAGKTEFSRRRMTDFLQLSIADRLRYYVKRKNTPEIRAQMTGEIVAFLKGLRDAGRVVEDFDVLGDQVNTPSGRAQGIERILVRVRLIGHMLSIVIETEIGTGVVITREAA